VATDPTEILKKLGEHYRGIKFGRGVVGKTSYVILGLIGLWTAIIFRLSPDMWLSGALFAAGLIITGVSIWWVRGTQAFAEKNPELAMLEGAELVEYKKWEAEIKGLSGPVRGRTIPDPHKALPGSDQDTDP
jgi:hypothetical protein